MYGCEFQLRGELQPAQDGEGAEREGHIPAGADPQGSRDAVGHVRAE